MSVPEPDLIALAQTAEDDGAFLKAISQAAFTGKKRALLGFLKHISKVGLRANHARLRDRSVVLEVDHRPEQHDIAMTHTPADLQVAVAMSLSFDRELDSWNVTGREYRRMFWTAGAAWMSNLSEDSGRVRKVWTDVDEQLLQEAISLWRPGGPLATKTSTPNQDIVRLMVSVGRYVHHPEAINCFQRADIDMNIFTEWTVDPKNPDSIENDRLWIRELSTKEPLPVAMLHHRNIVGATALLNSWSSPEGRNIARQIADSATAVDLSNTVSEHILKIIADDHAKVDGPTGARHEALEFLDALDRIHPNLSSSSAKLTLIGGVIAMQNRRGDDRDVDFIQAALQSPSRSTGGTIQEALVQWRTHTEGRSSVFANKGSDLAFAAVESLHHELLKSCKSILLKEAIEHPDLIQARIIRAAGDLNPGMQVKAEDFRTTLDALADIGFPLWGIENTLDQPVEGSVRKTTSLLHELAASKNASYATALIVALEMGADPTLRDHAKRRAASLIKQPERKTHWMAIESSYAARQAAEVALAEIQRQGLKP